MDKVFIIEIAWNIKGDTGHDILAVTTEDCVTAVFEKLVKQEKSESYLVDFFNDDNTLKEGVMEELSEYIDTDKEFMLVTKDYEYFTNLFITEKPILKNTDDYGKI